MHWKRYYYHFSGILISTLLSLSLHTASRFGYAAKLTLWHMELVSSCWLTFKTVFPLLFSRFLVSFQTIDISWLFCAFIQIKKMYKTREWLTFAFKLWNANTFCKIHIGNSLNIHVLRLCLFSTSFYRFSRLCVSYDHSEIGFSMRNCEPELCTYGFLSFLFSKNERLLNQ